jgi:hypothetical protein
MEELRAGMIEISGLDADLVTKLINAVWGEDSVQARADQLGGALDPTSGYHFQRAYRAAGVPPRTWSRMRGR